MSQRALSFATNLLRASNSCNGRYLGIWKNGVVTSSLSFQRALMATLSSFTEAVEKSTQISEPDNSTKLKMYALYKQATSGKVSTKRPGAMDFVGRAKWDAWNALGDMSNDEAKKVYTELVASLLPAGSTGSAGTAATSSSSETASQGFTVEVANGIRKITLNRPEKKNALTVEVYQGVSKALREANTDNNTRIVVLTGAGDFFSSGNDLGNFTNVKMEDVPKMARGAHDVLLAYVASYIDCRKPMVAVVNGPAVGVSVTVLGLFDAVYATEKATFTTPFSALGQSPEGCSSYIFPRIMGYAKASELLYFNSKINAQEAEACGLVSKVFPHDQLQKEAELLINAMSKLPVKSLVYSKELVRGRERDLLHSVNKAECERLLERWQSEDCMNAIMAFFARRAK